jgi:hypothetical protein
MARATTFPTDLLGRAKGFFGREAEAKPALVKKAAQTFHAVSIVSSGGCCAAARAIEGKRFLSRQAPILPLKACDKASCQCLYEHHEDRRKGPRRTRDFGVSVAPWDDGPDVRSKVARGRRKTDR